MFQDQMHLKKQLPSLDLYFLTTMSSVLTLREPGPSNRCSTIQSSRRRMHMRPCFRLKGPASSSRRRGNLSKRLNLSLQEIRSRRGSHLLNNHPSLSHKLVKMTESRPVRFKPLILRSRSNLLRSKLLLMWGNLLPVSLFNFKMRVAMPRMRRPSPAIVRSARGITFLSTSK